MRSYSQTVIIISTKKKFKWSYKTFTSAYKNLEQGFYKTPTHIIDSLNYLLRKLKLKECKNPGVYFFSQASKKIKLRFLKAGFHMTQGLADVIGLRENNFTGPVKAIESRTLDVHRDNSLIYVYCDLIEQRLVGDTLAPLLRILPMTNLTNDISHYIFQKPHYISLAKFQLYINSFNYRYW